tara:strand:+ start:252 stop:4085 length:3834 start_codon:yes stop_codon:yes gene_type:complete
MIDKNNDGIPDHLQPEVFEAIGSGNTPIGTPEQPTKPLFDREGNPLELEVTPPVEQEEPVQESQPVEQSEPVVVEEQQEEPNVGIARFDRNGEPLEVEQARLPDKSPKPMFDREGNPLELEVKPDRGLMEQMGFSTGMNDLIENGSALPQGIEAGTYTADDLLEKKYFDPIKEHLEYRRGESWVKSKTDEELIDGFLQERRSTSVGNTVRGLSSFTYVQSVKNNPEEFKATAAAYSIFDKMEGEVSLNAVADYARGIALDPINLVGGLLAKGVTGVRVAKQVIQRAGAREFAKILAVLTAKGGMPPEAIRKAATKAGQKVIDRLTLEGSQSFAETIAHKQVASALAKTNGVQKLVREGALKDILIVTGVDSVVNTGMEVIYQNTLVDLSVREDIDELAVGLAFVGGAAMGGVQAVRAATKGVSGLQLPSMSIEAPSGKNVLAELADTLKKFSEENVPKSGSWAEKVNLGRGVEAPSAEGTAELMSNLLLGRTYEDGGVGFKGLAQLTMERGLFHVKTSRDDTYSDWIADIIKDASQGEVDSIVDVLTNSLKINVPELKGITPEDFGNLFARLSSDQARGMGAIGRAAQLNSIDAADLDVGRFLDTVLDEGLFSKGGATAKQVGRTTELIGAYQDRVVRLLTAHASTSFLNMAGWAGGAAFGTTSDLGVALLHAGTGTMKALVGSKGARSEFEIATGFLRAAASRPLLLLDSQTTSEAFQSYQVARLGRLGRLDEVIGGGIEQRTKKIFGEHMSPTDLMIGSRIDSVIEGTQRLAGVMGQDTFTKSQEFTYQFDKMLRTKGIEVPGGQTLRFKGGWKEFFNPELNPDLSKIVNTKEYLLAEADIVSKTLDGIFSRSYKGPGVIGEVAAVIEDARRIPGVGLLVPFGRFFNSTVSFTTAATPMGLVMKAMGKYDDRTFKEVFSRAAVGTGLVYTMAEREGYLRDLGVGIGQDVDDKTGQVYDSKYDYPMSYFKYASRIVSYHLRGEEVPTEIIEQTKAQLGSTGLTRNLDKTSKDFTAIFENLAQGDSAGMWAAVGTATGAIGSQVIAGVTRPLEPINVAVGLVNRGEYITPDRLQGAGRFTNTALRSLDQVQNLLTSSEPIQKYTAAGGATPIQPSKLTGARTMESITDIDRMYNNAGLQSWRLNESRNVSNGLPAQANRYNQIFWQTLDGKASYWWNRGFADMPQESKEAFIGKLVSEAKQITESMILYEGSRAGDGTGIAYTIYKKYSPAEIRRASEVVGVEDLDQASIQQLSAILTNLKVVEDLDLTGAFDSFSE